MKLASILAVFLWAGLSLADDSMNDEFVRLYSDGNYAQALVQLQKSPKYDSGYFYNSALVNQKLGHVGTAYAHALKAIRLKPHDSEILSLLRSLKSEWLKKYPSAQAAPASTKLELFVDRISEDDLLTVIGLLSFVVSLLWARAYLRTRKIREAAQHPSGWIGALALVVAYGVFGVYQFGTTNPPAVVVQNQDHYSGPGMQYTKTGSIVAGSVVRKKGNAVELKDSESWQQIRIKPDEWAWIPSSALLPL